MKRRVVITTILLILLGFSFVFAGGATEAKLKKGEYPPGKLTVWTYGMPEYMRIYFQNYIDREETPVKDVTVEMVNYKGEGDVRQQVQMDLTAGTLDGLPTAISTFPVSMQVLADAGVLKDLTDKLAPYKDLFVDGAFEQGTYNGKIYGLPYTLQPKMMFYNNDLFEKYDIDPERMKTMSGYLEVGKELKEKSNGKTYLSYVDPGSYTWRYWFRRGLMPQANAKIWDEEGNVVFDKDPGTRLAMDTFKEMMDADLLLNVGMFSPPLYEAARREELATFYIESFWDSFLRSNLGDMAGSWRCMPAPVFDEVGTAGAQVIAMYCVIDKPNNPYADLFVDILLDFNTNIAERNKWSDQMLAMALPTEHPIVREMLADPYWSTSSDFYGGQSYKQMVTKSFENPSSNLAVTQNDAEADVVISAELEKYVAGAQSMDFTIKEIGSKLRSRLNLK
ncbi:MAG: ABC transporter substrate-binding protein [Bacilli bacterium]